MIILVDFPSILPHLWGVLVLKLMNPCDQDPFMVSVCCTFRWCCAALLSVIVLWCATFHITDLVLEGNASLNLLLAVHDVVPGLHSVWHLISFLGERTRNSIPSCFNCSIKKLAKKCVNPYHMAEDVWLCLVECHSLPEELVTHIYLHIHQISDSGWL